MVINTRYSARTIHGLEEAAEICLKCGVCCVVKGYSCPAQYDGQFTPRHTYVYDCLGHDDPTSNTNIWQCVSCHKCEEMCPYEVSPVHYIETLKSMALEEGHAPEMVLGEMRLVLSTGYAFPITANTTRQREALGLPPLEESDELKVIAEKTGLLSVLEFGKIGQ